MKFEISDPAERHLILVERYQNSSVNIVVKTKINHVIYERDMCLAVKHLLRKHPYLNARYFIDNSSGEYRYFYQEMKDPQYRIECFPIMDKKCLDIMDSLSDLRSYCFNYAAGELFRVKVYQSENFSIVELVASHIIGEVPSIIILMGDILKNIDSLVGGVPVCSDRKEKYIFNEADFSWQDFNYTNLGLETAKIEKATNNPWVLSESKLRREKFPVDLYQKIKSWVLKSAADVIVSDIFYYAANQVLKELLGKDPDMWLILSYRGNSIDNKMHDGIYNFAYFSPISCESFAQDDDRKWLRSFAANRNSAISADGVYQVRNFIYSLNIAMQGEGIERGIDIMNAYINLPEFAFNNFGKIDRYIGELKNIDILDIEIQDGTPTQEMRYFSYKEEIYMNLTLFRNSGLNIDKFWRLFIDRIHAIIS